MYNVICGGLSRRNAKTRPNGHIEFDRLVFTALFHDKILNHPYAYFKSLRTLMIM